MNELPRAAVAPWARRGSMFSQAGLARPVDWASPRDLDRLRASRARERLDRPLVPTSVASPRLGDELFARLLAYGTPQQTHRGDVLFRPGDEDADLIVVERGSAEVVRTATGNAPAATVAVVDAGGFVGELNLWFDADTPMGQTMMDSSGLTQDDLPVVVLPDPTLKRTTPGELAEKLGLSYRRASTKPVEVTIVGAGPAWATLGRRPLPFETNVPGVFAVGDVHSGSMKRVAAATGEGASAIASVHKAIAALA